MPAGIARVTVTPTTGGDAVKTDGSRDVASEHPVHPSPTPDSSVLALTVAADRAIYNARCGGSPQFGVTCVPTTDKAAWKRAAEACDEAVEATRAVHSVDVLRMGSRGAYAWTMYGQIPTAIERYLHTVSDVEWFLSVRGVVRSSGVVWSRADFAQLSAEFRYALAGSYLSAFAPRAAADVLHGVVVDARLDPAERVKLAKEAIGLWGVLDDRAKITTVLTIASKLYPLEGAKLSYAVAEQDFRRWNSDGPDVGDNQQARLRATAMLASFYAAHKTQPELATQALEAIWRVAKAKRAGGDGTYRDALKETVAAWDFMNRRGPVGPNGKPLALALPFADYGAEAELTLIDEEIRANFDYETGHHRYGALTPQQVFGVNYPGLYQAALNEATQYDAKLSHVIATYPSPFFVPAAFARIGSLYESLRTALSDCVGVCLGGPSAATAWQVQRDREMDLADAQMVYAYATARTLAQAYDAPHPLVTHARNRLVYFGGVFGRVKMIGYGGALRGHYIDADVGSSGLVVFPEGITALPLPVAP